MESPGKTSFDPKLYSRRSTVVQLLAGVVACSSALGYGMNTGFSAVALPAMTSSNSTLHMTYDESSWFASLSAASTVFGCLLAGVIMDGFGRRFLLLLTNLPRILGWILLAALPYDKSWLTMCQLYSGRLLTGLSSGLTASIGTIYVAEIASSPALRETMVTWSSVTASGGILTVYMLGALLQHDWRMIAAVSAIFPALVFLLTLFIPETPIWLIAKNKQEDALRALKFLRGEKPNSKNEMVEAEFKQILAARKSDPEERNYFADLKYSTRPEVWKPLLIINVFFFFQQATGLFVVVYYAVDVVLAAGVTVDEYLTTVSIGVATFLMTLVTNVASKRFGRRSIALTSGIGLTTCLGALSLYLYVIKIYKPAGNFDWIPLVGLLLYVMFATYGFLTLPWAMLGEIFPARVRGMCCSSTTSFMNIFSFVFIKIYPYCLNVLEIHGVFLLYCVMGLLATVFIFVFLPETRGKTEIEIQQYFIGEENRNLLSARRTEISVETKRY